MHDELTANDIKKMEDEIEYRKLVVRKKALDDVKVARAQGDLSENFEYKAAKQFKNQNESRIRLPLSYPMSQRMMRWVCSIRLMCILRMMMRLRHTRLSQP